ncbi:MAG: MFS transporter [Pseudomonadota bacterium]
MNLPKELPVKLNLPMSTLLLLISFASVNAVLFTPALPSIAHYFSVSDNAVQHTITWFLIGYGIGQLLYGPLADRFGRKPSLYAGISIQIVSSFLCILAGMAHSLFLLVLARFFLAIGSGVGLTMAFTLVNESFSPKVANQKISYLLLAFAITPGLSIALGGILSSHYGWMSCFYVGAAYGVVLLFLTSNLTETHTTLNLKALNFKHLITTYLRQFRNPALTLGGLLMGGATCFIYIFATLAPFLAINLLGMSSSEYGIANILPSMGSLIGAVFSAEFAKKYSYKSGIRLGILITGLSVIFMILMTWFIPKSPLLTLFSPMLLVYVGLSLIYANASTFAMSNTSDKAHGSAVMNFINIGVVIIAVLSLSLFSGTQRLLLIVYTLIVAGMVIVYRFANVKSHKKVS